MKLLLKKASSLFLAIAIVFGMLPTLQDSIAYADDYALSNPRTTENETVWDCIYFGSYPQTEVVAERSQCGVYEIEAMHDNPCIVNTEIYNQLENNVEWGSDDVGWLGDSKYKRIKLENATYASEYLTPWNYNWSDADSYHYFKFEPIKWRVLNIDGNNALLLSDLGLDYQRYNENEHSVTWENCSLRNWLNNVFYDTFSIEEKESIYSTYLINEDVEDLFYEMEEEPNTNDKVFLLSQSDVYYTDRAVNYGFTKLRDRHVKRTAKSSTYTKAMGAFRCVDEDEPDSFGCCEWYLRSPGYDTGYYDCAAVVNWLGYVNYQGFPVNSAEAVRPALHLNLSKNVWSYAGTVSSNGSTGELDTCFYGVDKAVQTVSMGANYSDSLFNQTSTSYHNDIAKCALVLANNCESSQSAIEETMHDWNFEIIDSNNYSNDAICDNPAYSIGYKTINKDNSEKHLIAMTIRGTSNWGDILSDLKAFAGKDGFLTAGNNMAQKLRNAVGSIENEKKVDLTQENTVLFISGHSLGGACAGQVARLCGDLTNDSNRYVYTFAAPQFDTQGDQKFDGVFNVCNVNDSVPLWNLGSYIKIPLTPKIWINKYSRIGTDKWCVTDNKNSTFNKNMEMFYENYNPYAQYGLDWQNHLPSTYMASLITEEPHGAAISGKSVFEFIYSFFCPVDIEVYDSKGNLVGMTVNGEAQNVGTSLVYIISEDGHKFVLLPDDQEYTIKVIGDDAGTMQFVKQTINNENDEIVSEKTFDNVSIYDGKLMLTTNDPTELEEVKLYVVDEEGNATKEVLTDGTEVPIGESTAYGIIAEAQGHGEVLVTVNDIKVAEAEEGAEVTFTAVPNQGYRLKEWVDVRNNANITEHAIDNPLTVTMPAAEIKIKAVFEAIPPLGDTVTVQDNGHGTATASIDENGLVTLTPVPESGYALKEWKVVSGELEASAIINNQFNMPEGNVTLKAIFAPLYTITAEVDGHGISAEAKVESEVATSAFEGAKVILTATPKEGYVFDRWQTISGGVNVQNDGTDDYFEMPATNVKVKALFKAIELDSYGIIAEAQGHGTVDAKVGGQVATSAAKNASVVFTAVPEEGYRLKEWIDMRSNANITGHTSDNPLTVNMPAAEIKIKAVFIAENDETYTIINKAPKASKEQNHGYIEVSEKASSGEKVTVKVHPNKGYKLEKLTYTPIGDKAKNITLTKSFTMPDKDVAVDASFKKDSWEPIIPINPVIPIIPIEPIIPADKYYSVHFDVQGIGSAITDVKVKEGSLVAMPQAPVAEDYVFDGWFKEASCINAWNFTTDIVTKDTTLYAKWISKDDITTDLAKAAKVSLTKATAYKNGKIKLSFKNLKLENGVKVINYQVYRSTSKKSNKSLKKYSIKRTADTKNYTWTNAKKLKKGTKYYYKVRGKIQLSDGTYVYTKWSNVKSAKCKKTR